MRRFFHLMVGAVVFADVAHAGVASKVAYPQPVEAGVLEDDPYRFNGLVLSDLGRGSGFCAWNSKAFFSAAHVVYDTGEWAAPPEWYGLVNADTIDSTEAVQSRGYFRWKAYAALADAHGISSSRTFSKDVILAYALTDLITGDPAEVDFQGYQHLQGDNPLMITGYPAVIDYTGDANTYFLHQTGPVVMNFQKGLDRYVKTTLLSTGPGNSGGPVWSQTDGQSWRAAGVLVSGLPGEAGVYAFSPDINALIRSAAPVVNDVPPKKPYAIAKVDRSSFVYSMAKSSPIPDGVARWTNFPFGVKFGAGETVTKVLLNLEIETSHRGDLIVYLQAPNGAWEAISVEEGGAEQNLILTDEDLSASFSGVEARGRWVLRVQDRLKGDIAIVKRITLEISCD